MNFTKTLAVILMTTWTSAFAYVPMPISDLEIAEKQSDLDDVYLRAMITYPNGCYESRTQLDGIGANGNTIYLEHYAEKDRTFCTQALEVQNVIFNLEEYGQGSYKLVDGFDMEPLGRLIVDDQGKHRIIVDRPN